MLAVILAGGFGKRLMPFTSSTPKALLKIDGKSILDRQIGWLSGHGISNFIVSAGYLHEKFESHLNGMANAAVIAEPEPLGTAGALKLASKLIKKEERFIVVNGDVISEINPNDLSLGNRHIASMALVPLRSTYGVVAINGGDVTGFREKPVLEGYWLNAGIYLMSSKVLAMLPDKGDLGKDVFPALASKGLLGCSTFTGKYWISIDSIKDLEEAEKDLK